MSRAMAAPPYRSPNGDSALERKPPSVGRYEQWPSPRRADHPALVPILSGRPWRVVTLPGVIPAASAASVKAGSGGGNLSLRRRQRRWEAGCLAAAAGGTCGLGNERGRRGCGPPGGTAVARRRARAAGGGDDPAAGI